MRIRQFAILSATAVVYGAAVFDGAAHAQSNVQTPGLTTYQSVISTGPTLISAAGYPYAVSIMDSRFGAKCDVTDYTSRYNSSTTAGSNTISVGTLVPVVNQHIAIPGVGHVSSASDLYVNYGNTATSILHAGMNYAQGDTITMSNGDVLVVDTVTGTPPGVSVYHVKSYAGSSATTGTTTQSSTSGSGSGFALTAIWTGPTYSGTITSFTMGSPNTIAVTPDMPVGGGTMTMGVSQSPIAYFAYGDDDSAAIGTAFTSATSYGISGVLIPGNSGGGCGTISAIALPANSANATYTSQNPYLMGEYGQNSHLYLLAPATNLAKASGSVNSNGGGVIGVQLDGMGLVSDSVLEVVGNRGFQIDKSTVMNATGGATNLKIGDGTTSTGAARITSSKMYTNQNWWSGGQMPQYSCYATSTGTDGFWFADECYNASGRDAYFNGPDQQVVGLHVFNNFAPNNAPQFGIEAGATGVYLISPHVDNAFGAPQSGSPDDTGGGILVSASNDIIWGASFSCSSWYITPPSPSSSILPTIPAIELESTTTYNVVSGTTVNSSGTNNCAFTPQNVVHFDNNVMNATDQLFANTGASTGQLGSNMTFAPPPTTAPAWGSNGIGLVVKPQTYTDSTSSGPVASVYVHRIGQPTIAASSMMGATYTNAYTLGIAGPSPGTGATFTNHAALLLSDNLDMDNQNVLNVDQLLSSTNSAVDLTSGGVALDVNGGTAPVTAFKATSAGLFGPGTTTASVTETGYWCYDTSKQFIRDSVSCLTSLEAFKNILGGIRVLPALEEVLRLAPFWYEWNQKTHPTYDAGVQPGFGAGAVKEIDPRLTFADGHGRLEGVRYEQMTALLAAAIQGQTYLLAGGFFLMLCWNMWLTSKLLAAHPRGARTLRSHPPAAEAL
jgi:hypothetical protein